MEDDRPYNETYLDLFDELWESGRYEEAINVYEFLGRIFWRAEDVGKYYESKCLFDRAIAEYEALIEVYFAMGKNFLPLPGGPPELFKVGRWYERTDPVKAEKYLRLYLLAEHKHLGTYKPIEYKQEAEAALKRILKQI